MSKEFFEQQGFEKGSYTYEDIGDLVDLPVTREGFEALLQRALEVGGLPLNDEARMVFCGLVHHIQRDTATTTIQTLATHLRKHLANALTTMIYNEIDQKLRAQREATKLAAIPNPSTSEVS